MRHQSYPAITRRGHLKSILLAVLILLNLAAQSWSQIPAHPQPSASDNGRASATNEAPAVPANTVFALLVGAGLLVAGKTRRRTYQPQHHVPAADFEMALRVQNMPRVRVDQMPLYRDRSDCLRRIASRLGCDQ